MGKTLGLDLGTNSLGWAILDDLTGDILDKGVVVFPEGIDAANDTLETPAAIRRAARMARRMKFRRKVRKWMLLKVLIDNGMCPMSHEELDAWRKSGKYPTDNRPFINWLKSTDTSNPYADRAASANGKVPPLVLGRALYHIAQRRGFKSSRKDADEGGDNDKSLGAVKGDIAALTKEIADAGCRTLGQYFATRIEDEIVLHMRELAVKCRRLRDEAWSTSSSTMRGKPPRLMDLYKDYFLNEIGIDEDAWQRLYLRGDSTYAVDPARPDRLPAVQLGMIRNPLVQRSMTTLRRLVNYLRDHGKIDADTTIRIELARGVNDFATRHAIQQWQKDREKLRAKARAELGDNATEDLVDRYIMWEEQGRKCLYTSKTISLTDLVTGSVFDIEHTIPRSMSGDDSLANKTLCDAKYNRQVKRGMVPTDCPNYETEIYTNLAPWRRKVEELEKVHRSQKKAAKSATDPQMKANARTKAVRTWLELTYWRDKLRRFEITSDKLADPENGISGFKRRQLVDTGIMSSHAVEFLRSVYPCVHSVNGTATAFARKAWGIQGDEAKDRTEHTHHAKDAMVIAALTPGRFNAICTALKDDGAFIARPCDVCKPPYDGFADKVRVATSEILVKHVLRQTTLRQSSKRNALAKAHPLKSDPSKTVKHVLSRGDTVRGPLHKDTFYGCILRPDTGDKAFVVRKTLDGPIASAEQIAEKIVDPAIRQIVKDALASLKSNGITKIEPGMIKMPSGVPINKVRIFAHTTNPSELRMHDMASDKPYKTPYYVTASEGSNFRLGVFVKDGKASVKPDNSLQWAQNHKKADYIPLDKMDGFVGYIFPGSMAIAAEHGSIEDVYALGANELSKRLYKVVKFRSDGLVTFRLHIEARASVVLAKDLVDQGKHKAGESSIDFVNPHELLLLSPGVFLKQMLFEGIHFRMMLDGSIKFLK